MQCNRLHVCFLSHSVSNYMAVRALAGPCASPVCANSPSTRLPGTRFSGTRLPAQGCRHKVTFFAKVLRTSSLAPAQGPAQGNPSHSGKFGARGRFRGKKHKNDSKHCKTHAHDVWKKLYETFANIRTPLKHLWTPIKTFTNLCTPINTHENPLSSYDCLWPPMENLWKSFEVLLRPRPWSPRPR